MFFCFDYNFYNLKITLAAKTALYNGKNEEEIFKHWTIGIDTQYSNNPCTPSFVTYACYAKFIFLIIYTSQFSISF